MSYSTSIINKFGGTRKFAAALNLPPSTVQSWKDTGRIPSKHQQAVLDRAREKGLAVSPDDFFEVTQ